MSISTFVILWLLVNVPAWIVAINLGDRVGRPWSGFLAAWLFSWPGVLLAWLVVRRLDRGAVR